MTERSSNSQELRFLGADKAYEKGDTRHLSSTEGSDRLLDVYQLMQRGLVYPSPYSRFVMFWKTENAEISREVVRAGVEKTRDLVLQDRYREAHTSAVVGVSFELFKKWCDKHEMSYPAGMEFELPKVVVGNDGSKRTTSTVFERSSGSFEDSGATLFVHIKSDNQAHLGELFDFVVEQLGDLVDRVVYEDGDSRRTRESADGKVLGCRFSENLNNPADPITVANHTLVGYEDAEHAGASYLLAQRFNINWEQLHNMTEEQIEDIIGRTTDDVLIPTRDSRSHLKAARQRDERGNSMFILRLGLPFGRSSDMDDPALVEKGANLRDEKGIYFAGFARSVKNFETIMDNQIGDTAGFMNDRLFNHAKSDLGGFFYIPSRRDLGLEHEEWEGRAKRDWSDFPGVDWKRLSRHFSDKSDNGLMYYNHKNYLYEMATMGPDPESGLEPPSTRILNLLLDMFVRWQDTWYFEKGQAEMGHLCQYIAADFGPEKAEEVMALPIMERKGWAIKMTCRLYASDDYGYRGRRPPNDDRGQEGADTYRIHPMELIVGALPDLSLAQGRYVMKYFRPEEEMPNFFRGLTEASGIGHILPDHQKLVDLGLGGLLSELEARLEATEDSEKQSFYRACILSVEGVQDHLSSYAVLASGMAGGLAAGQAAEKANLEGIAERLRRLTTEKPQTMLEAAQLIFTMHSCLQLNAEPVAIGRLDQYLNRFYEQDLAAGRLTQDEAQEIIDAFWVKLDEKVLQNRLFIQDHQPFGNLAMGGGSGPYPQGASLGQWIQQITVGGIVGDDDPEPKLAYNEVTKLCLRASARLPLNAPCLALRVRKDTPREYLEEAAKTLLSGGAHPVLMNDDKIIPGLQESGDLIGDGSPDDGNDFTPLREKAEGRWRSEVSLASARNYACDGCYEPMFVGQNWFTLGGFSTLNPLECALNQGRLYASAGPAYLRGQNHSFRSSPAAEINSFEDLLELYFKHFYWLCAKSLNGQLSTFDAVASVCPTPLLSVLIDDCVDKGLDLYGGGARYNIYAPCFIGLSSTINSLYNIKKMVFDKETAVTSLPELVNCLICDWGHKMVEPMVSTLIGQTRVEAKAERWKRGRELALRYPRYGRTDEEIDENGNRVVSEECKELHALGDRIVSAIAELTAKVFREPVESTAAQMLDYAKKYGTKEQPFGFQIQPGAGTFENFVAFGGWSGASADGRRLGESLASDCSSAPSSMDRPPDPQTARFSSSLAAFSGYPGGESWEGTTKFWDGAPTDFNIDESFPLEDLVRVLSEFADGRGSNILTITTASPKTLAEAPSRPEKYDLLRVRMGGWSEFFTSMFPESQRQQQRRPMSTPEQD